MKQLKEIKRITVSEMSPHVHSFGIGENKVDKIYVWLSNWITEKLKSGEISVGDYLPSKGDLAFHIGVSKGTIQSVYRILEDNNFVESKQRIGTYIKDKNNKQKIGLKLTSKREIAVEKIKQFIIDNKYKQGDTLVTARMLAKMLKIPFSTIQSSLNTLVLENVLVKKKNSFVVLITDFDIKNLEQKTLVEKTAELIREYTLNNISKGNKLPSNLELSRIFDVSVKTIHDAVKILAKEGFILVRRGRYGTTLLDGNSEPQIYNYEKAEQKIRKYILKNCEIGSKLPSIRNLAEMLKVSTKTVKTALDNLADEGYITFSRGRYGGIFVTDIPQTENETYTWLALNPNYISELDN